MRVRYRQLAPIDLAEIFLYLSKRSPSGAQNVLEAVNAAIADIAENPPERAENLGRCRSR